MSFILDKRKKKYKYLNSLPTPYKERIDFDNPKSMDEAVRKAQWVLPIVQK